MWRSDKAEWRVLVENHSYVEEEKIQEITKTLKEILREEPPKSLLVEVWNHPRDVFPPYVLWFWQVCHYDPDKIDGMAQRNRVILYERAFLGDDIRLLHIALHEIGHYLDRNPLTFFCQGWRERRADQFAQKMGYGH